MQPNDGNMLVDSCTACVPARYTMYCPPYCLKGENLGLHIGLVYLSVGPSFCPSDAISQKWLIGMYVPYRVLVHLIMFYSDYFEPLYIVTGEKAFFPL